jgi:hypothetical protein
LWLGVAVAAGTPIRKAAGNLQFIFESPYYFRLRNGIMKYGANLLSVFDPNNAPDISH